MRKHKTLVVGVACALMNINTANAIAVINPDLDTQCYIVPAGCTTANSSCNVICSTCTDITGGPNDYGIMTTDSRSVSTSCTGSIYFGCTCDITGTSYACGAGYYGTATSSSTGCTACPDNATCAGGNGSTFTCNSGYIKLNSNPTVCTKCPDNAEICTMGTIYCKAGYYLDGDTCEQCPLYVKPGNGIMADSLSPGSSPQGSTSITDCYIPSGTAFSDETGVGTYDGDCYYEELIKI